MTQIMFLGTAGDNHVLSKCQRNSGGIVVQHGELQFHIDPGPNSLMAAKAYGVNPRATTAIICTSAKLSHSNDVNALISAMTYNGMDVKGVVMGTKMLVEGDAENQPVLRSFFRKCVERVMIIEPEKRIGVENVDFQFLLADDYCDTVGLKMYLPDLTIGYTSDTAYSDKIARQYEKCDVLIMNIQNPGSVKSKNRMSTEDAIKLVERAKPELAILTHFGKDMLEADAILEARRVHTETKCQVMSAVDGQVITPHNFSNPKQKA